MKNKKLIITVSCVFITVIVAIVACLWKEWCNGAFFNGAHCYFLKNRTQDIIELSTCTFWEEGVFRMLPFLVATILIILSNPKWLRYSLYIIFGILIICVQLKFGAAHYDITSDESYERPLIVHGILGIMISVTYAAILVIMLEVPKEARNHNAQYPMYN